MRLLAVILSSLLIAGCASHRKPKPEPRPVAQLNPASAALAFDVPSAQPLPEFALNRDVRQRSAYVGYDEAITTYAYIRTDDRQYIYDRFNDFERQAIIAKTWVSVR